MKAEDMYSGRRPKKSEGKPANGTLKQGAGSKSARVGIGDTKDAHLSGKGSPYSAAHVGRKK